MTVYQKRDRVVPFRIAWIARYTAEAGRPGISGYIDLTRISLNWKPAPSRFTRRERCVLKYDETPKRNYPTVVYVKDTFICWHFTYVEKT